MQKIFQIDTSDLDQNFLESVKSMFGARRVKIAIEDLPEDASVDQMEIFYRMEKLRESLKHIRVDPSIDISRLADNMLDTPL